MEPKDEKILGHALHFHELKCLEISKNLFTVIDFFVTKFRIFFQTGESSNLV